MKKTITALSLILITLLSTSAYMVKYNNGIAGYTGSPGETSCSTPGCHSGGSSSSSAITITSTPTFTNDEYVPGTVYTISVTVVADGFSHYGFGCEILNDDNANAGTMQTAGTGVKFLTAGSRKDAVHTTPKTGTSATFTFHWKAPDEGNGNATIYAAGNAVNLNNSSSGDFPIAPVSMILSEGAVPVFAGIRSNALSLASPVSVYPNPASGLTTISYALNEATTVVVELIDITGKTVKELVNEKQTAGGHSQLLNLQAVQAGVYFIKTSVNNQKVSQKLITVL